MKCIILTVNDHYFGHNQQQYMNSVTFPRYHAPTTFKIKTNKLIKSNVFPGDIIGWFWQSFQRVP